MLNDFSMEEIEQMERLVGSTPDHHEHSHYDSGKLLHKKRVRSNHKKNKQDEVRNSSYEPNV
jgi:hypothetical protein